MKKIILFITLFLFAVSTVSANEVTLIREKIDNVYVNYYDLNLRKNRYLYAEKYFFEDKTAYCLELGKSIEDNIYTYSTSFDEYNISKEDLEYIKLITYYGYDYPGHDTNEYYMAAQELIWHRTCNTYPNWVIGLMSSNIIDISEEMNTILTLKDSHYTKPSFDGTTIEFTIGEELILEDENAVLDRFITTNENIVIEDNKLIIKENFSDEEIVLIKPNYDENQFFLYTSGVSQKMISTGTLEEVESSLKVKLTGGTVEITKLDEDTNKDIPQGEATLKGAVYELYDENNTLIDTITTGTKDKIENLPLGKYKLKEKTPSIGYLLDETIYDIEITKDNLNVKLNVYEEVIKRKVEIFKVFASNTTGILSPEADITFEIYDNNKSLIDKVTTDSEGYTSIVLPYGTYTFKQINSTENYYKVEAFTVTINEYDERPIHKLLSDSEITAKVKIIKKDLDTKENIINSTIKFKIFDVKNDKYLSLKVSYPENKETEEFQIDKNGIFITPIALSPGEYIIEEVSEPMNGYLYNNEKVTFTIGESTNFIEDSGELYLEIPFYNRRVKGAINIIKSGEELKYKDNTYYYKEIPLEKVIFNLYAKKDIYENGKIIYQKDELIKELITDKEGKVTESNLPLGEYYIKEVSTAKGYLIDEKIYDINLSYKNENTEVITNTIKIKNYLLKGNLIINKYETNTTNPIPNTLIEIHSSNNEIVYKGYTNSEGQILIENLPYGEYYLSETEASTGYRLLEDKISFQITEKETTINVYNERIKVPNTGLSLSKIDILLIVLITLIAVLLVVFKKEKRALIFLIILLLLGIAYFTINIYIKQKEYKNNEEAVEAYLNNEIDIIPEEKYQYNSILEIPSIDLKRGLLDINSEYNDAKYNIELIKEEENTLVLAAHNGTNGNSFFGKLSTIELGDSIKYYKNGNIYEYIYSENYDIKKNGYADLYLKEDIKSIVLITCKDNTDDAQTVYIGYLNEISTY